MFKNCRIVIIFLLLILVIGRCSKGPQIERVNVDRSVTTTHTNAYGQPDIVTSNNGYPIIEYIWNSAWIDKLIASFYFTNIGNNGECEFIVSINEEKTQIFKLKANTSYILRIRVNEFGVTGPWNMTSWEAYTASIKVMDIETEISFNSPHAMKKADDELKLLDFQIFVEEMVETGQKDLSNIPDNEWFKNSVWEYKYKYGSIIHDYIKFRNDGFFGYSDKEEGKFEFDGNETWEIKDGNLMLNWNGGYAIVEFELTNKNTSVLFGTHSNSKVLRMLQRIQN